MTVLLMPTVVGSVILGLASQRGSVVSPILLYWTMSALAVFGAAIACIALLLTLNAAIKKLSGESCRAENLTVDQNGLCSRTLGFVPWSHVCLFTEARADDDGAGWWRLHVLDRIPWAVYLAPGEGPSAKAFDVAIQEAHLRASDALNADGSPRFFWAEVSHPRVELALRQCPVWLGVLSVPWGLSLTEGRAAALVLVPVLMFGVWLSAFVLMMALEAALSPLLAPKLFFVGRDMLFDRHARPLLSFADCEWEFVVEEIEGQWRRRLVFWRGDTKLMELSGEAKPFPEYRGGMPGLVGWLKTHHADGMRSMRTPAEPPQ
ncbi:hypothetical protein M8A51_09250 [Schlegelella sp. S2-27]|uniref:PH domain-containing protein n=1 Tax=Caldimonas mangrovi TaxID=2944811 RepID=A0ABT0YLY4_9BURK|nr:hypothetical protein [Caldimonas mangrovi]MCM5679720.1 hypothetical protein [Caldimonas mangrovi]